LITARIVVSRIGYVQTVVVILSKDEVILAQNARIWYIRQCRDYLNTQLNKVIISREKLLDELETLKKNFDLIQNKRYQAEQELDKYKLLIETIKDYNVAEDYDKHLEKILKDFEGTEG
jgi:hypothetical protein